MPDKILGIIEIFKCPTKWCIIWICYIYNLMAQFFSSLWITASISGMAGPTSSIMICTRWRLVVMPVPLSLKMGAISCLQVCENKQQIVPIRVKTPTMLAIDAQIRHRIKSQPSESRRPLVFLLRIRKIYPFIPACKVDRDDGWFIAN